MAGSKLVAPVLKWAGGKRQVLRHIKMYVPRSFAVYHEPFLGGGALLFELQPPEAAVNDINKELINVYQVIKDSVEELIADLKKHKNEEAYYYRVREQDRDREQYERLTAIQRASRVIYLNKTCYNGLFRVNKAGEFNTPFGGYARPNIVNEAVLRAVSDYFNRARITFTSLDFEEALKGVKCGDFVYLDPPYDPVSDTASFTGYDRGGFDREEQKRLKRTCDRLHKRGAKFILSNSATEFIKDLYKSYKTVVIKAKRPVNSRADKRGEIDELLVMNY